MEHIFLQLNSAKTEAIMISAPHQTQSTSITSVTFSGHNIPLSSPVSNLGVSGTVWYSSCAVSDCKSLQMELKSAQAVTGLLLGYMSREDAHYHQGPHTLQSGFLPSGKQYWSIQSVPST
ncbi:hypothetical protein AOLI_G00090600 [Acnodon oligacanthus]